MKKSKNVLGLLCFLTCLTATGGILVGCDEGNSSISSSIEEEIDIILDKTCVTVSEIESVTVSMQEEIEGVQWTSSDRSIAMVENGVVTPLRAGYVTVSAVLGKVKKDCSITFLPKEGVLPLYKNRAETFKFSLETEGLTSVSKTIYKEREIDFSFENSVLEVNTQHLLSGEGVLEIEGVKGGETTSVTLNMDVADFAIGNSFEWNDFGSYIAQNSFSGKKAVLTADIDYQNQEFNANVSAGTRNMINGTLDGCGYTISNLRCEESFSMRGHYGLFDDCKNMKMLNIAFVNINVAGAVGVFARTMENAYLENVYVQGHWTAKSTKSDGGGALAYYASGVTGKNLLVQVEMSGDINPRKDPYEIGYGCDNHAVAGFGMQLLQNVYVMSTTSNGHYSTWCDFPENGALFDRYEWFLEAQQEILTVFDSPYWKMVDGVVRLTPLK